MIRFMCWPNRKKLLDILRFAKSQRQEVMVTSLKKMTLGILRFELSQRQEVMATSLNK